MELHLASLQQEHPMDGIQTTIPPEILSQIFLHTVSTQSVFYWGSSDTLGTSRITRYTPWRIRQVCSSWRQIALQCMSLWNRIAIEAPTGGDTFLWGFGGSGWDPDIERPTVSLLWPMILDNVVRLIPPTGPLFIGISGIRPGRNSKSISTIFHSPYGVEFLRSNAHRIGGLNLHYVPIQRLIHVAGLPTTSFTILERLSLDFGNHDQSDIDLLPSVSCETQSLRRLSISSTWTLLSGLLADTQMPWNHLTDLSLVAIDSVAQGPNHTLLDTTHLLSVLAECQGLERLDLMTSICMTDTELMLNITLARLRVLVLGTDMWPLHVLTIPSLTHLELKRSPIREDIPDVARLVNDLVERSDCRLRVFRETPGNPRFLGIIIDRHRLVFNRLIDSLSYAEEVIIHGMIFTSEHIARLATSKLLPKARSVVITAELPSAKTLDILSQRFRYRRSYMIPSSTLHRRIHADI